jgi:two-component sensor histidine kinase
MLVTHEPASAASVRRALRADLAAHDIAPESIDEVLLVTSELVGNAVRHTAPVGEQDLIVSWQLSRNSVVVEVSDPSPQRPVLRRASPDEPSGRGLIVVDAIATQWGTDDNASGKQVWAEVALRHRYDNAPALSGHFAG